jgi:hypothetical protein
MFECHRQSWSASMRMRRGSEITRSELVRRAVAAEVGAPGRIGLDEALDLLDAKARAGSTPAIIRVVDRLLREWDRQHADQRSDLAEFGLRPVTDLTSGASPAEALQGRPPLCGLRPDQRAARAASRPATTRPAAGAHRRFTPRLSEPQNNTPRGH